MDLSRVNFTEIGAAAGGQIDRVVNKVMPASTQPPPSDEKDEDEEDEEEKDGNKKSLIPGMSGPSSDGGNVPAATLFPSSLSPQSPAPTSRLVEVISAAPINGGANSPNGSSASSINTKDKNEKGSGSKTSAGAIIGIVVGFMAIVAVIVFVVRRRKNQQTRKAKSLSSPTQTTQQSTRYNANTVLDDTTANYSNMPDTKDLMVMHQNNTLQHSTSTMAEDPEITAMRIPMEKLQLGQVISRGGFGEVYKGTYKGEPVAIKRLLPDRRKDLRQIDAFLAEAKMMGALEHERIVQFVGVAWDALTDVCVVSEFMHGGDLRSTLVQWENEEHRLHGFDHDKIKIALHVAHAMTYLHSLQPVLLHRDLKSKNILLSEDYDAKITDFGVSREAGDATMTAGVGSSLWMAPEVMMGERYDEKADIFSFGVVLAELDTHQMPYSHATEPGTGRKLPDTAILQMVTLGRLTVEFSASTDQDMANLGRDCVKIDPKERPTAAEALHRVHQVWRSCVSL